MAGIEALRKQTIDVPRIQEKIDEPEFGAFIQILQKRGDNISCLSYPLPPGISTKKAIQTMSAILYPDRTPDIADVYLSSSGELAFMKRSDRPKDIIQRYLAVPSLYFGIDQEQRRNELKNGVLQEFAAGLQGRRYDNAQNSKGKTIYALSYKVDRERGGVFGLGINGKENQLSKLAMEGYEEHRRMLEAMEQVLLSNEDITIVNFDKSITVSLCCALFFKEKMKQGFEAIRNKLKELLSLYVGSDNARLLLAETEKETCGKCGSEHGEEKCGNK